MRIGIDISQIIYEGTGVARFTQGLTDAIISYGNEEQWLLFFSSLRRSLPPELVKKLHKDFITLRCLKIPPTALAWLWNDLHTCPVEMVAGAQDWFITSDWTEPPSKLNKATIVHDLTFQRYPLTVATSILNTHAKRLGWVEQESNIIFADSESTKKDLMHYYEIPGSKIVVNYPGVEVKKQSEEYIATTLKKFTLTRPFILTVGKIEPRKNLKRLIQAYTKLPMDDVDLVIVGPPGWQEIKDLYTDELSERIHFLGYICDSELYALYQAALFFVFPSIWEGFGYPAGEAMMLGCPTALSNTSSLKEIGDGHSRLFDPTSVEDIEHTLQEMIQNTDLRKDLTQKGLHHSQSFTWKKYYDTMITSLKR